MPAPEHILNKVKLLYNLVNSSNANEAASAKAMAEKLIVKYNITEEELRELQKRPVEYSQDALLFKTYSIVGWMQHLALACAKQFYCHIVQEICTPLTGTQEYNYYVYGEDDDVNYTKFTFATFHKKINNLLSTKCIGRGPIYCDSYCEGVVESVKANLAMAGIEIPEAKQAKRSPGQDDKTLNNGSSNLAKIEKETPQKPEKETVDVSKHSLIKDVMAYFKGIEDGNNLSLQEILELEAENEEAKKLAE